MAILSWIVLGAFIGLSTLFFCEDTEKDSRTLLFLTGLVGSVIGGLTGRCTGFIIQDANFWNLEDWISSGIGTCLFLLIWTSLFIKKESENIPNPSLK